MQHLEEIEQERLQQLEAIEQERLQSVEAWEKRSDAKLLTDLGITFDGEFYRYCDGQYTYKYEILEQAVKYAEQQLKKSK